MDDGCTYQLGIDETLSAYISDTAGLIAELDGTSALYETDTGRFVPQHVIYLDKSRRPCSWLAKMFWRYFAETNASAPSCSFLNIDESVLFLAIRFYLSIKKGVLLCTAKPKVFIVITV